MNGSKGFWWPSACLFINCYMTTSMFFGSCCLGLVFVAFCRLLVALFAGCRPDIVCPGFCFSFETEMRSLAPGNCI